MKNIISICKKTHIHFSNILKNTNNSKILIGVEGGGCNGLKYFIKPINDEYKLDKFDEKINIKNIEYKENINPIDKNCLCYTCKNFTLSYLHHLFASHELLGLQLITNHNIFFINNLMKTIRTAIKNNDFEIKRKEWLES